MMNKIYRRILKFFVKVPSQELTWSVKDFQLAKKIMKTMDHPTDSNMSMWDYFNSPWNDSVDVLHYVNNVIRVKQTKYQ
jgi:hypothetical protein